MFFLVILELLDRLLSLQGGSHKIRIEQERPILSDQMILACQYITGLNLQFCFCHFEFNIPIMIYLAAFRKEPMISQMNTMYILILILYINPNS